MTTYVLEITTKSKKTYIPFGSKYGALEFRARVTKYDNVIGTRVLFSLPDGYMYPLKDTET